MPPHPDVDLLALHALGEPAFGGDEQRHVATCPDCRRTVAELSHTVRTVRGPAVTDVDAVPVPAHVWQGVAAELGLDPAVRPASVGPSAVGRPRTGRVGSGSLPVQGTGAADRTGDLAAGATAVPSGSSGRRARADRPTARLLAVAAAGIVLGSAGTAALTQLRAAPTGPPQDVVAVADLEEFGVGEGTGAGGSASLTGTAGPVSAEQRVLQVRLDQVPDQGDAFLEAWLIDPESGAMVSLGPVPTPEDADAAVELAVPAGLDLGTYTLVDVSAEPLDGDPTHSGASLVRGSLRT